LSLNGVSNASTIMGLVSWDFREILITTYAQLAPLVRYASNIPGTHNEPRAFAVTCRGLRRFLASAARLTDDALTPIPIYLIIQEK
jgi:hypothetical protein